MDAQLESKGFVTDDMPASTATDDKNANLCLDADAWDDSMIMTIYNEAVSNHKTLAKGTKRKKKLIVEDFDARKVARESNGGIPGEWAKVDLSAATKAEDGCETVTDIEADADDKASGLISHNMTMQGTGPQAHESASTPSSSSEHAKLLDSALSDMVNAAYQSGYAAGRYYALKECLSMQDRDTSHSRGGMSEKSDSVAKDASRSPT
jgi:hypothetical protein